MLTSFFYFAEDNFPKDVLNAWYGPKDPSLTIIASKHVTYAGHVVAIAIAGKYM